jgi:hypothetical protein
MKKITFLVLFVTMFLVINALVASAADWYDCKIVELYEKKGDIIITVNPGEQETGFQDIPSRIKIDRDSKTANKDLAIILTAANMGCELMISLKEPPSWTQQKPVALGFTMP